jgi:hypothetical protein
MIITPDNNYTAFNRPSLMTVNSLTDMDKKEADKIRVPAVQTVNALPIYQ